MHAKRSALPLALALPKKNTNSWTSFSPDIPVNASMPSQLFVVQRFDGGVPHCGPEQSGRVMLPSQSSRMTTYMRLSRCLALRRCSHRERRLRYPAKSLSNVSIAWSLQFVRRTRVSTRSNFSMILRAG